MMKMIGFSKKQNLFRVLHAPRENVFSPEEFKALVQYERTRSDRNGSVFSIAIFNLFSDDQEDLEKWLVKVTDYTRSIDCVGWNEQGGIVVLLPDTLKEGAVIFGEKVMIGMREIDKPGISYDIYAYPEHWLSNNELNIADEARNSKDLKKTIEFLFVKKVPPWKRSLDIFGSLVLLICTSPILFITGLYIKMVSPGPIFFKQIRIGYKGVPFVFWKFRTMKFENNQGFHGKHAQDFIKNGDVPMEKLDSHDPRIIPGGKLLRKSCIDELPQLWNILRGDMSLVGPRPCIPYEAQEYLRWHTHRFDTMPGLSGLWQISGKNKLTFKQMIRLDITYCENITLLGDLAIILQTPFVILKMVFASVYSKVEKTVETDRIISVSPESSYSEKIRGTVNS